MCGAELNPGDGILLFPECFGEAQPSPCPPPPNPLGITVPGVVEVGSPVMLIVTSYVNATGAPSPAVGVTVTGGGTSATTDANGRATLTFSDPGSVVLHASAQGSVRTEATVCVHRVNDGACGTQASSSSSSMSASASSGVAGAGYAGPNAIVAKAGGVIDGHVYKSGLAPRLLKGTVSGSGGLQDVKLRLTRRQRHGRKARCSYYDGLTERFRAMPCGASHGRYFSIGARASVSYLLPSALAPGRYVLDIEAIDAAGNQTKLARGTSRIVFYVG